MSNSFLFIIPLTPLNLLTENRRYLRDLCFKNLSQQNYTNWKAILIGSKHKLELDNKHFIQIDFEGAKEEKLQMATKYYSDNNLNFNYIIRLDDDDIFNPNLLNRLSTSRFDIYTDKYHAFMNSTNAQVSQLIKYWFPNTCIIKSTHALSEFGIFPTGEYKQFKNKPLLIENEHNDFHKYFNSGYTISISKKKAPVYLRLLNADSITSKSNLDYTNYLNQFGFWHKNNFKDFSFLNNCFNKSLLQLPVKQNLSTRLSFFKKNLISAIRYNKLVILKNTKLQ